VRATSGSVGDQLVELVAAEVLLEDIVLATVSLIPEGLTEEIRHLAELGKEVALQHGAGTSWQADVEEKLLS
jgi:hypothetical protein